MNRGKVKEELLDAAYNMLSSEEYHEYERVIHTLSSKQLERELVYRDLYGF